MRLLESGVCGGGRRGKILKKVLTVTMPCRALWEGGEPRHLLSCSAEHATVVKSAYGNNLVGNKYY